MQADSLTDEPLGKLSSFQSLSHVRLFVTPWTAASQASLSIASSRSLLKLMTIETVMPSNQFILCHPLLLLPSVFPRIRVFSNESILHVRWPKYWSFSFSISPSNEYSGLVSFRMDWLISFQSKGLSRVFSNTTVQKHPFTRETQSSAANIKATVMPSLLLRPHVPLGFTSTASGSGCNSIHFHSPHESPVRNQTVCVLSHHSPA